MKALRSPFKTRALHNSLVAAGLLGLSASCLAAPAHFTWPTTPIDRGACPAPTAVQVQPGNGSLTTGASGSFALDTAPRFVSTVLADSSRNAAQPEIVPSPNYRIPGLEVTNDGQIVAVWDGRPTYMDLPSNLVQLIRTSKDQGATWTGQRLYRGNATPHGYGDPSLLVDRVSGRLFSFYTHGQNAGFGSGRDGNHPDDPNATHLQYSYSDDGGATWTSRDITTVKPPSWRGIFFASGAGTQLQHGPCAGRLINQVAAKLADGQVVAASVYSDDHGLSWHMGQPAGQGLADENKVVELSDGRVMLNSRASWAGGMTRYVAYSNNGGYSYGAFTAAPDLPDPRNNGHIMRVHPMAQPGSPDSRMLMFVNTAAQSRQNVTVRLSCDDGTTWPVSRVVDPGGSQYSVIQRLSDGSFGVLWEKNNDSRRIHFGRFNAAWLGSCSGAPSTQPPALSDQLAALQQPPFPVPAKPQIVAFSKPPVTHAVPLKGLGTPGSNVFIQVTDTAAGSTFKPIQTVVEVNTAGRWLADLPISTKGRYEVRLYARHGGAQASETVVNRFNVETDTLTPSLSGFGSSPKAHAVTLSGKGLASSVVRLILTPTDGRAAISSTATVTANGTWSAMPDLAEGRYTVELSATKDGVTSRKVVDHFGVAP